MQIWIIWEDLNDTDYRLLFGLCWCVCIREGQRQWKEGTKGIGRRRGLLCRKGLQPKSRWESETKEDQDGTLALFSHFVCILLLKSPFFFFFLGLGLKSLQNRSLLQVFLSIDFKGSCLLDYSICKKRYHGKIGMSVCLLNFKFSSRVKFFWQVGKTVNSIFRRRLCANLVGGLIVRLVISMLKSFPFTLLEIRSMQKQNINLVIF